MKTSLPVSMIIGVSFRLPVLKSGAASCRSVKTADTGKIVLGGGVRLPVKTADTGKIVLGGGVRLPVKMADTGKIVLGGGVRLPLKTA